MTIWGILMNHSSHALDTTQCLLGLNTTLKSLTDFFFISWNRYSNFVKSFIPMRYTTYHVWTMQPKKIGTTWEKLVPILLILNVYCSFSTIIFSNEKALLICMFFCHNLRVKCSNVVIINVDNFEILTCSEKLTPILTTLRMSHIIYIL